MRRTFSIVLLFLGLAGLASAGCAAAPQTLQPTVSTDHPDAPADVPEDPQEATEGGTEFGNPVRLVVGHLLQAPTLSAALTAQTAPACPADTVIAVDSASNEITAQVMDDCSFQIELSPNRLYRLRFESQKALTALLVVEATPLFDRTVFFIGEDIDPLDLGEIRIVGDRAAASNNPLAQSDRDGDGLNDEVDDDDDGDGTPDIAEADCDLDGFQDDSDDDSACTALSAGHAPLIEASPFQGQAGIAVDENVNVRVGCTINMNFFPADVLTVELVPEGTAVSCANMPQEGDTVITCDLGPNLFQAGRTYKATLREVVCVDGQSTRETSWTFTTVN